MPTRLQHLEGTAVQVFDPTLDARVNEELAEATRSKPIWRAASGPQPPNVVDLFPYVHLVRCQGGAGCWGYSTVAVWDIMNEMKCPFSPNLSMRIWMMLHRRRELWEKQHGMLTPDGRFHKFSNPEFGFLQSFGNVTEGTERTLHFWPSQWPDGGWSNEGIDEASNYRLASEPLPIELSSSAFVEALAAGKPFRLRIDGTNWGHWVAVIGYDKLAGTFTYLNSGGDRWGIKGCGTFTFAEVDAGQAMGAKIGAAETFDIHVPRPVPAARIAFEHTNRANVALGLSIEDSPHPPRRVWPQGADENSNDLCITVRLPSELVWPPTPSSRVVLDLFDTARYGSSGGTLTQFQIAFGGHVISSPDVPVTFQAREHLRLTLH